jgi:putative transposase
MYPGSPAEPVLAAWGITTGGKPAFIGLAPGSGESAGAWHDFLADLKDRGLASPLLIISDGAPGPDLRDRAGLPQSAAPAVCHPPGEKHPGQDPGRDAGQVKDAYWKIFDTEDLTTAPGPELVEIIDARISEMAARYGATYPSAMKCLTTDREGLTAYLRFPAGHHHRIRHSNFIERTFGETRRRVKVIGRLPGETSCLTLVWAVPGRASRGWRGLTMTADGLRLLQDLRRSLLEPPAQLRPRTVTTAQPQITPKLSVPSPNLTMKPEPRPPIYTGFRTPPTTSWPQPKRRLPDKPSEARRYRRAHPRRPEQVSNFRTP